MFFEGWEKQTERCDMSLTSLPVEPLVPAIMILRAALTSRTLHRDYPRLDVNLDCSIVSKNLACDPGSQVLAPWVAAKAPTKPTPRFQLRLQDSQNCTHHFQESSESPLSVCTSFWLLVEACHGVVFMDLRDWLNFADFVWEGSLAVPRR